MARKIPEPRPCPLPPGIMPLGLGRIAAAYYVSVSPTKFDQMVRDGRMPKPYYIDGCCRWSVLKLIAAHDALAGDAEARQPWRARV